MKTPATVSGKNDPEHGVGETIKTSTDDKFDKEKSKNHGSSAGGIISADAPDWKNIAASV